MVNLRDEVLGRVLAMGRDQVLGLTERSGHSLARPPGPQVLALRDLIALAASAETGLHSRASLRRKI